MVGSFAAGFLGSLTGLGGGIVVVPTLTLLFHVDLRSAIGASLVSVIATSSGAAAPYVREGYTTIRIGGLLEVATTVGALVGVALILLAIALQRDRLYEQRFPGPRRVMRGHVGDPKPGPQ
jgi:uncharacterized membrane protein YfcA